MEYNIERFCKAGLRNLNGYVFDVETTNKALDNYINKPIVLINKGEPYLGDVKKTDKIVGYMTNHSSESIKCFLYEGFIDENFDPQKYVAALGVSVNDINPDTGLCIVDSVKKIAI